MGVQRQAVFESKREEIVISVERIVAFQTQKSAMRASGREVEELRGASLISPSRDGGYEVVHSIVHLCAKGLLVFQRRKLDRKREMPVKNSGFVLKILHFLLEQRFDQPRVMQPTLHCIQALDNNVTGKLVQRSALEDSFTDELLLAALETEVQAGRARWQAIIIEVIGGAIELLG